MKFSPKPWIWLTAAWVMASPEPAYAMHIAEGILPAPWALLWFAAAMPFMALGIRELRRRGEEVPHFKAFVGLVGAALFIISCMPIPIPIAGTSSHPCGTGLAAVLVGPFVTVVLASIALLLQALFLAHGGLTTLGANIVSMGVAGAFVGFGFYRLSLRFGLPAVAAAFIAGLTSDWATYAMTSIQLSFALHTAGAFYSMLAAILVAFMPTQIPLGVLEGILSAGAYRFVVQRRPEMLRFGRPEIPMEVTK